MVRAEVAAHQSSGNEGIVFGIAVISRVGRRSPCDRDVRQLNGSGLRHQAGQDGFPFPLLVGQPTSEVVRESRRPPRCEVSTRAVQCSGRSPQPLGSGSRDRVVSPPTGGERPASIDLFATSLNTKLPLYCSFVPDPQAVFKDAFHHPWANLDLYVFPPFPLVGRVVARVRETPNLVHVLNLHMWRLSSVSSKSRAFCKVLLLRCPAASTHPLPCCTRRSGCFSVADVVERVLLQSTPL